MILTFLSGLTGCLSSTVVQGIESLLEGVYTTWSTKLGPQGPFRRSEQPARSLKETLQSRHFLGVVHEEGVESALQLHINPRIAPLFGQRYGPAKGWGVFAEYTCGHSGLKSLFIKQSISSGMPSVSNFFIQSSLRKQQHHLRQVYRADLHVLLKATHIPQGPIFEMSSTSPQSPIS